MEIIVRPKDKIFTWINGNVYSAEVIYVVKGTSSVKAIINNKYKKIEHLKYGENFSMTYNKALQSANEWKREQEEFEIRSNSQKLSIMQGSIKREPIENRSIMPPKCESCGYPIVGGYLCKCSN
ncbi:hypothetical protein [Psychrobacillus sp. L3]|uniref:hypothetical protein n=1 Tax=Psychrobacillus sp. L3 TaxID=3236891 RepID=UPI0036F1E349